MATDDDDDPTLIKSGQKVLIHLALKCLEYTTTGYRKLGCNKVSLAPTPAMWDHHHQSPLKYGHQLISITDGDEEQSNNSFIYITH